jgi:hypothetical protein
LPRFHALPAPNGVLTLPLDQIAEKFFESSAHLWPNAYRV